MVSFSAYGERSAQYTQIYNSHLDETSPLTNLLKNNGKIMLFGIGFEKCTLYHLAEERNLVPYNFYKTFEGNLIKGDQKIPISQRYFVRKNLAVKKSNTTVTNLMFERSLVKSSNLGKGKIYVFNAKDYDDCCMEVLNDNPLAFVEKNI